MPTTSQVTCTGPWTELVGASETRWCLRPGQHLAYRQWDGKCVLYNDLSGDTHLLSDDALALLLALRDGDIDADELAAPELADLLASLRQLDLIESC